MNDRLPVHLKFGYDHMVEMAAIRAELSAKGIAGTELHFTAVREYEVRHAGDLTYKERCEERPPAGAAYRDPFREALELIRDGHNDPRTLAREILLVVAEQ